MKSLLTILTFTICLNGNIFSQSVEEAKMWADSVVKVMSMDEKIGQLFMIRAYSNKDETHYKSIEEQIKKYHVGGVCFFQGTPEKQASLTNRYQKKTAIPLMVSMDAEWGLGMRHKSAAISYPKQLTLGAISDNSLVYDMGYAIADQLKQIGTHINFAPVVDVNNNANNPVIHNRSFGEDVYNVSTKSYAYMKGLQDNGVMACAKHFPGHGDTDVDSHYDLPVVKHGIPRLDSLELTPFRVMSQLGCQSMMVAHLSVPSLDDRPNRPTSLSRKVITELLKNKMHYEGLIFTDGLEMQGVAKHFKPGTMELEAIKAGNDVLLLPIDIATAFDSIKNQILTDKMGIEVIEQKTLRILQAKYLLGLNEKVDLGSTDSIAYRVNDPDYLNLKSKLYEKAVTLVQDKSEAIPILDNEHETTASIAIGTDESTVFQQRLSKYGITDHHILNSKFSLEEKKKIKSKLHDIKNVIIGIHDMSISNSKKFNISEEAFDLIFELNSTKNVILVIFGSPYALKYFPAVKTIVQAYEEDPLMQEAAADALLGTNGIEGKLPVSAHDAFPVNTGLVKSSISRLGYSRPEQVGILSDSLLAIDTIVEEMIRLKGAPGCQILAARHGKIFFNKSYGYHTYDGIRRVSNDDVYDVASVTKTLATTIALMKMHDERNLNIHKPLKYYLDDVDTTNKADLIIEDILAHHSGLPGWIPFYRETIDPDNEDDKKRLEKYYRSESSDSFALRITDDIYLRTDYADSIYSKIYSCDLRTNKDYRYSDLGYYLFKKIIENANQMALDAYVQEYFYKPLGLKNTMFNPIDKLDPSKIVPSEKDDYFRCQVVQGHVHDMGAAMLGGVCGHAGLFSTAEDLAVLMQMLLNGGHYSGKQYLKPQTIQKFTRRYYKSSRRGLGFDMKELDDSKVLNISEKASDLAFGHLGFTGISVFADPKYDLIFIFLSNRTYPTMKNSIFSKNNYRPRVQSVFYNAIMDSERN
ncbi:MAG: serine hydrolase [Saprospiraceae bacterium]|nr:serine hydrolase [Saprospiraceae bacterium]